MTVTTDNLQATIEAREADIAALRLALKQYISGPDPFGMVRKVFETTTAGLELLAELLAARQVVAVARRVLSQHLNVSALWAVLRDYDAAIGDRQARAASPLWDAAVGLERERCARLAEQTQTPEGYAIAASIREGVPG